MSLYVVLSPSCPYFRKGTFIEDVDSILVQEVHAETVDGRLQAGGAIGLAVPKSMVRKHVLRVQKLELDKSW